MTRSSFCSSCRAHLKNRLRNRILHLQSQRYSYHATRALCAEITAPDGSRSWYWDTTPPTSRDLASATTFFRKYLPRKLWTATEWRQQNEPTDGTLIPEVAFLGRSNVGKSSLLNALLLSPQLNHVGPRPGKTTTMHAWGLAASDPLTGGALKGHKGDTSVKIAVLDMPGYGHASQGDWGSEIITYLRRRKQLKRVFILLDALHGVKDSDLRMLDLLRKQAISHQVVASKCDRLGRGKTGQTALTEALWQMRDAAQPKSRAGGPVGLGEILAAGALGDGRKNDDVRYKTMFGIEEVRYAVLRAAGLEDGKSLQDVIPNLEEKESTTSLYWKPLIDRKESEADATERTSSSAYAPLDFPEARNSRPPSSTKTAAQTDATGAAMAALMEASSAKITRAAPPCASEAQGKPPWYPPRNLTRRKGVEPVVPIHQTKVALAVDTVHSSLPKLPSTGGRDPAKPYAGTIGYGLHDLYEMTKSKPDRDNKVKRVMTHLVLEGQGARAHRQRSKLAKVNARQGLPQRRDAS